MNNDVPFVFESIFKEEFHNYILGKKAQGLQFHRTKCLRIKKMDVFFKALDLQKKQINSNIVDMWLKKAPTIKAKTKYFLDILGFCKYLNALGYKNIIIPNYVDYHISYSKDFIPYIFSSDEINIIFKMARNNILKFNDKLNYKTFYTLISLYYTCGLRCSEALNIKYKDYNFKTKELTILGKNNVARLIPLNESVSNVLESYINKNEYLNSDSFIFLNSKYKHYSWSSLYYMLKEVLKQANIPKTYQGKSQRIHDFRHTFAVNALKQMQQKGFDLYTSLNVLSTFLGHNSIIETEYYLRLLPQNDKEIFDKTNNYSKKIYKEKMVFYESES